MDSNPKRITKACAHIFKYAIGVIRTILILGEELVQKLLYLLTYYNFVRALLLVEAVCAIISNIFRSFTVTRPENLNKKLQNGNLVKIIISSLV